MSRSNYLTFKSLNRRVEEIANDYFDSKKKMRELQLYSFSKPSDDDHTDLALLVAHVENAFECLDELEKMFINNDFFYESYPFWWESFYARCTYYRYKRKAMRHFLIAYGHQ